MLLTPLSSINLTYVCAALRGIRTTRSCKGLISPFYYVNIVACEAWEKNKVWITNWDEYIEVSWLWYCWTGLVDWTRRTMFRDSTQSVRLSWHFNDALSWWYKHSTVPDHNADSAVMVDGTLSFLWQRLGTLFLLSYLQLELVKPTRIYVCVAEWRWYQANQIDVRKYDTKWSALNALKSWLDLNTNLPHL